MTSQKSVSLLYFGRRGGGAQLLLFLSNELKASKIFSINSIAIRYDNEVLDKLDQDKKRIVFKYGYSPTSFFKILYYKFFPQKLLNLLEMKQGDVCLVPMISPLGLLIEKILELKDVRIIRFIHDSQRHAGDIWPTNKTINKVICSSDYVITLSKNVDNQIRKTNPSLRTSIYPHPAFNFSTAENRLVLPNQYILFIGRIREYKGLDLLIEAMKFLSSLKIDLVIAGEGAFPMDHNERITLINRWLTEEEISELIRRSMIVAFPYLESSQSGFIPYCAKVNKKILITNLDGLREQLVGYKNFEISGFTPGEVASAIKKLLLQPLQSSNEMESGDSTTNIDAVLLASGYFES